LGLTQQERKGFYRGSGGIDEKESVKGEECLKEL